METSTNSKTLVALFDDYSSAQKAVRELENEGIPQDAISIRSSQKTAGAGSSGSDYTNEGEEGGGFGGWLHRLFGGDSEDEHSHYDEALRRGNAVVTVNTEGTNYDSAVAILNQNGAVDIDKRIDAWRGTGYTGYNKSAESYTSEQASSERDRFRNTEQSGAVPVIEEELQVGKRVVQRGGVRVYSRVIDQPVEEQVNLREEHVRVERRPANRPVSDAELSGLRDQTIEVTQMAEEPVVSKRARVTEEVVVGKEATERTETIRDNVRRTEVTVDSLEGSDATSAASGTTGSNAKGYGSTGSGASSSTTSGATSGTSSGTTDYAQVGSRYASDARFKNMTWDNAEQDIRTDYLRSNPNSSWDQVKGDIRTGWQKVTGQR